MAKIKSKAAAGRAGSAVRLRKPRIVKINSVRILWENRAFGLLGTVPLPRPKGKPVAVLVVLPEYE